MGFGRGVGGVEDRVGGYVGFYGCLVGVEVEV